MIIDELQIYALVHLNLNGSVEHIQPHILHKEGNRENYIHLKPILGRIYPATL